MTDLPNTLPDSRSTTLLPAPDKQLSVRDVFGWSRPFRPGLLPDALVRLMEEAGALVRDGDLMRATIRLSSLDGELFAHSAYPPSATDAVFFGPDTVRFVGAVT